jgi:hypothetical protein
VYPFACILTWLLDHLTVVNGFHFFNFVLDLFVNNVLHLHWVVLQNFLL